MTLNKFLSLFSSKIITKLEYLKLSPEVSQELNFFSQHWETQRDGIESQIITNDKMNRSLNIFYLHKIKKNFTSSVNQG